MISLLEILAKAFERVFNQQLRTFRESNGLLSTRQFGFQSNASTEVTLNSTIAYIKIIIIKKYKNSPHFRKALVTKDVHITFDTVCHTGLTYKIGNNFQLPLITQKLLCSFLQERQTIIRHMGSFLPFFNPQAGVPQESVLS